MFYYRGGGATKEVVRKNWKQNGAHHGWVPKILSTLYPLKWPTIVSASFLKHICYAITETKLIELHNEENYHLYNICGFRSIFRSLRNQTSNVTIMVLEHSANCFIIDVLGQIYQVGRFYSGQLIAPNIWEYLVKRYIRCNCSKCFDKGPFKNISLI